MFEPPSVRFVPTVASDKQSEKDCLSLEDETDRLYRNVVNYKSMLRISPMRNFLTN